MNAKIKSKEDRTTLVNSIIEKARLPKSSRTKNYFTVDQLRFLDLVLDGLPREDNSAKERTKSS